jgi:hypothetical protein
MRIVDDDPSPGRNKLGPYPLANASKGNGQFWEGAKIPVYIIKD